MFTSPHLLVLLVLLVACVALVAEAGTKTLTLEEPLNRAWKDELVSYPFAAPVGQCTREGIALTGPKGPLPVQLSEVQLWPNSPFVKSAKLSFVVEALPAQTTQSYTINYGLQPETTFPAADLAVKPATTNVELLTSRFGVRLLLGEKTFDPPKPAAEVPGPIMALRLGDGTWFGNSRLNGLTAIKGYAAKLVAEGPAFARVEITYTYADGNTFTLIGQLNAGDSHLLLDMDVAKDRPDDGWDLVLTEGLTYTGGLKVVGARSWSKEMPVVLDAKSVEPAFYLCPWPGDGWFLDSPAAVQLKVAGKPDELHLTARDAGAWVQPDKNAPWINFTKWADGLPPRMWEGWMRKRIPVRVTDTSVFMHVSLAQGARKWAVGGDTSGMHLWDAMQCKVTGHHTVEIPPLAEVTAMTLTWADGVRHPALFMTAAEMAEAGAKQGKALQDAQDLDKFRAALDGLGNMDLMRAVMDAAGRYDACIDSPLLTPQERKLRRAQMYFLCWQVANPAHWSYERGYCSGNPNMTVSRMANLGIAAMAIRDNPQGQAWAKYAQEWMKYWLDNVVDDSGYWPESSHYARVSWADYVHYAVAARQAGLYDFFKEPKFKAMALFYEKMLTPPDPLRYAYTDLPVKVQAAHPRVNPPVGRGTRGDAWGLNALVARATAVSDPALSRTMQWSWRESGFNGNVSHGTGGFQVLYTDRSLPAECPNWGSEYFPPLGYLFRSHVGDPRENYLLFVSQYHRNADGEIWPGDTGTLAKWFANGVPLAGNFHRIPDVSHPMMENRVLLATNWDPAKGVQPDSWYTTKATQLAYTTQPRADYAAARFEIIETKPYHSFMPKDAPAFPVRAQVGKVPMTWQRQVLLVKDTLAGGPSYLVLRDNVRGGQPSQWHFWSLSEKLGAPAEVADRAAFLANKPGAKTAPLRALAGDRFTALGQFGTDLEYYVASPAATPRYTLRYGYTTGAYGIGGNFAEYQDLLHLQLPGDGDYFVALVPNAAGHPAPVFTTMGNGTVIKVAGTLGTDYAFLARDAATVTAEGAAFNGTAASVQDRAAGLILALAAPGSVGYRDFGFAAPAAATLTVAPYALTLHLPDGTAALTLTLRAPGAWTLAPNQPGVTLAKKKTGYQLTVPAGVQTVEMVKG